MTVYNFSAGPAMLPEAVMSRIKDDLPDFQRIGASVMEISHRGKAFLQVAERAEADLRELLAVPEDYAVLFLQGGATLQFSLLAMNLARQGQVADYLITGNWGKKAVSEATGLIDARVVASAEGGGFRGVPAREHWQCSDQAAYLHVTPNETVVGVEMQQLPEGVEVPIVADMSSTLLSRPIDVSRYGMIYAGAQKNIGPSGLALVIVRRDLLGRHGRKLPGMWDYQVHDKHDSMFNTPCTFSWYAAGLVFDWLKRLGGLTAIAERNHRKATALYAAIDASDFYRNEVSVPVRSWMNVAFHLADDSLSPVFVSEAEQAGLLGLKGHRIVGGLRASLYNAMPEEGVDALIDFMHDFEARHG